MRRITTSLIVAGALAGLAGAVVTYQSAASNVVERPVSAPAAAPAPVTRLLPCESGTKLVKGVCIRTKHRVVVREVAAAAPVQANSPARKADPGEGRSHGTRGPSKDTGRGPVESGDDSNEDHDGEHESEDEDHEDHEDHDELDD